MSMYEGDTGKFKDYTAMLFLAGVLDQKGYEDVTDHLDRINQEPAGALARLTETRIEASDAQD